jgi:two-component system cell cycle response regulator CtrA
MFGVLIVVLGADGVTGYSLSTSEFQISFVVSSCVLDRRVSGANGNSLRPQTGWCCRLPFAPSHRLWSIPHGSFLVFVLACRPNLGEQDFVNQERLVFPVGFHRSDRAGRHRGRSSRGQKADGMRALLIEDDSVTAQSIALILKSDRFDVCIAALGDEGVSLGKLHDYDIILLDLNLPDMSGFEVLRSLRVFKVITPILILSGIAGTDSKVKGLRFGADDYMTKPFHRDELMARIRAIVRRSQLYAPSLIQTGDLVLNLDSKTVEIDQARVHFTGKEYQMLELLSLRKATAVSKEMFLNHLYGGMDEPDMKIIDVFISKLRKKLAGASNGKDYIETLWGQGYHLREPVERKVGISA